jgi:hypothetical protein
MTPQTAPSPCVEWICVSSDECRSGVVPVALAVLSPRRRGLPVVAVDLVGVGLDVEPAIHEEHEQVEFVETPAGRAGRRPRRGVGALLFSCLGRQQVS